MKHNINVGNRFLCGKAELKDFIKKAEAEASNLVKELAMFFNGNLSIAISYQEYAMGYSVKAALLLDGEEIEKDDCDLLFLKLNNLMLQKMIEAGATPFSVG